MDTAARIFLYLVGVGTAFVLTREGKTVGTLTPNQLVFLLTMLFLAFTL